ncbi:MAG: DUF87 domain-containing protein [Candidatus Bathyarchaeia archaeon]
MGLDGKIGELRDRLNELRFIGLTGSATQVTEAPLILLEGLEGEVREEDIAVIANRDGGFIFAVCRRGMGINENLRVGGYTPGIAYARSKGEPPSRAKESYHFTLSLIGALSGDGLKTNDRIVAPGSPVYLFDRRNEGLNPLAFIRPGDCVEGGHLANSEGNWPIPFNRAFIPYHIGVFGATGSGKSRLARHLLIPLLLGAGYGVLVFDWEGIDYAPHFEEEAISILDFRMDAHTASRFIARSADYFGYEREEDVVPSAVIQALTERRDGGAMWWDRVPAEAPNGSGLRDALRSRALGILRGRAKSKWDEYGAVWESRLDWGLGKIAEGDWDLLHRLSQGTATIEDFELPTPGRLSVIDMSDVSDGLKLSFFSSLCGRLLGLMRGAREPLNLALIIDEAPQYCPFEPKGIQAKTTEQIKDLCALGRKRGLCVALLAQGMAGEIGVNAAVRRNLNTLFIGQIHPLDLEEAGKRLQPYGIRAEELLFLDPGKFYLAGKMNPSPTPLLISFRIEG